MHTARPTFAASLALAILLTGCTTSEPKPADGPGARVGGVAEKDLIPWKARRTAPSRRWGLIYRSGRRPSAMA